MSSNQRYFNVEKLHGNSYSTVDLNIDGPDPIINNKVKEMQAKEFARVADARLVVQKQCFRYRITNERNKQNNLAKYSGEIIEDAYPTPTIEEEFADLKKSDFMPFNYTEEELLDIIIDVKMDEVKEDVVKKERCCAWVLSHCK